MKKLLVLVTILCIAPVASAVVTANLTATDTTVALNVTADMEDAYLAIVSDSGVLSTFVLGASAPGVSSSFGPITVNGQDGEVWGMGTAPGEDHVAGSWLEANWVSADAVWIRAYQTYDTATWTLLDEIEVPEPMTVALLGLGGLFMLRRRK